MTTFEFTMDEEILKKDMPRNAANISTDELQETMFDFPVLLEVGGVILLDARVPVYYLVASLDEVLELPQTKQVVLVLPGGGLIDLRLDRDDVVVRNFLGDEARTSYDELVTAWKRFAEKTREFMLRELPGVVANYELYEWLKQGLDD